MPHVAAAHRHVTRGAVGLQAPGQVTEQCLSLVSDDASIVQDEPAGLPPEVVGGTIAAEQRHVAVKPFDDAHDPPRRRERDVVVHARALSAADRQKVSQPHAP